MVGFDRTKKLHTARKNTLASLRKFSKLMVEDVRKEDMAKFNPKDSARVPTHKATPLARPGFVAGGKAKLRASITPGTVLILLAGRFKGKRVVFLKQLDSGLLLVTGPIKINGVPLRRVNQSFVIATSTKVDVSSVDASSLTDDFFVNKESKSKSGEFFAAEDGKKREVPAVRREIQMKVDGQLLSAVAAVPMLEKYLAARFKLTNGQAPHALKF